MQQLFKAGKYLFAFSIISFGIIQFGVQDFMKGFLDMPDNLPAHDFFLNFISTLFVAGGILMCIPKTMYRAAVLVGILLFILFIYPHLVTLLADIHNPNPWTGTAENLALASGALIITGDTRNPALSPGKSALSRNGKILFAISLIVFAVQHF